MTEIAEDTCLTCLGTGEVSSERGIARCGDCDGTGKIGTVFVRNEQRIRQIEARIDRLTGEAAQDAHWLVGELRRSRDALVQLLTLAQDLESDSELVGQIRFLANDAIGMYKAIGSKG